MTTKYEIVSVNNVDVMVDVSMLLKNEDLFFNATDMAKQFNKLPADFLRLQSTKEYIDEIIKDSGNGISHNENLIKITQGGKYQGTWLHHELAYEFAGWLSATFRRSLHKWADARLKQETQRKLKRDEARTGYLPLTNAIQSAHENTETHHYSNEANMLNVIVTGMNAKKFKEVHGVDSVRDALSFEQIDRMANLQACDTSLISLGFDYYKRKELLSNLNSKLMLE
jgi:hypothetical protein